ncbi:MAG: flagellar hook protein FlgE [Pseudomonadota bacterium]
MSLYSALNAGVSGLSAHASALAVVADNITNIDTIGYKGTEAHFSTLVTDNGSGSSYSAGGVVAAPISLVSKQGLIQASSSSTDIAIDGGGFFVTKTSPSGSGDVAFTRAGSFQPDEEGFLRNAAGLYLYGWRLDGEGNYTNTGSVNALEPVRLTDLTGTAQATTKIQVRANLDSGAAVPTTDNSGNALPVTTVDGVDYVTIAKGSLVPDADGNTTVKPEFTRSFDVYDAQGAPHRLTAAYVKTGPNTWYSEVYSDPVTDVTGSNGNAVTDGIVASGTVKFNSNGSLDKAGSSSELFSPLSVEWSNGAASVPITLGFGSQDGIDGLTQFGSESALISSNVDGGLLGNLASVEISKTGVVSATFDDGTTRDVFQLPIATFQNPDGLTRLSGNAYTLSQKSGGLTLNEPGSLGAGKISSNALESSTVDLATEFTNMIRFQRAYSASSKIITTVDDMLQEVTNLKR